MAMEATMEIERLFFLVFKAVLKVNPLRCSGIQKRQRTDWE